MRSRRSLALAWLACVALGAGCSAPAAVRPVIADVPPHVSAPLAVTPSPPAPRANAPDAPFRSVPPVVEKADPLVLDAPETWTLPNGIRIFLFSDPDTFSVSVRAIVSRTEPSSALVIANEASLCSSKGFQTPGALLNEYRLSGGTLGGSASPSTLEMSMTAPYVESSRAMRAFAEMVAAPTFEASCVERILQKRRALKEVGAEVPAAVATLVAGRLSDEHSGTGPSRIDAAELATLTRADLIDAFAREVRPSRLTIVVAGRATRADVSNALQLFGEPWDSAPSVNATGKGKPKPAARETAAAVLVDVPSVAQAHIRVVFDVASPAKDAGSKELALSFAWRALAGGTGARLKHQFREDSGLSRIYDSWQRIDAGHRSMGFAIAAPLDRVEEALTLIETGLRSFAATGPTEDEVAAAKRARLAVLAAALESPADLSSTFVTFLKTSGPLDQFTNPEQAQAAITTEDVRRAAATFAPTAATVIVVGDRRKIESPLARVLNRAVQLRGVEGHRLAP